MLVSRGGVLAGLGPPGDHQQEDPLGRVGRSAVVEGDPGELVVAVDDVAEDGVQFLDGEGEVPAEGGEGHTAGDGEGVHGCGAGVGLEEEVAGYAVCALGADEQVAGFDGAVFEGCGDAVFGCRDG